ncbi:Cysteine-rich small domain-containing protein [Ectothiorhodospira magna]|uniref:Cysteine-rich small domain-containing protein n=1 Tax=Ectothiorhodospira magna TaxID=867345 RepID=A0A1H9GEG2_9GAMM|nr:cysteine-rich small domain-containing protein [Ectothiorhodospira magna]SEQ48501.1 Cysteine-rich small domain-containing protein [Ectothiorhodospira magna]
MASRDDTENEAYKGFTNSACPFMPCHRGITRAFNCLFCYCPLMAYDCPGPYTVFTDPQGKPHKDCSDCTLPHDGYRQSWHFIQKGLERPVFWNGCPQTRHRIVQPEDDRSSGP